jgi:hypothetical protein
MLAAAKLPDIASASIPDTLAALHESPSRESSRLEFKTAFFPAARNADRSGTN